MNKVVRASDVKNLRNVMNQLKGKRIQFMTVKGQMFRGIVKSVGKNFVIIQGHRINNRGKRISVIAPFFFPFTSFLFFAPFFFPPFFFPFF